MNIVVCCKFLPSVDDLVTREDGSVSLANAEWKINEADLNTVQAGVDLAKATGGKLIALTVGDRHIESGKLKKDLLSRGPEELFQVISDDLQTADPSVLSRILAAAVSKIGADVVICGDGSEDYYNQQTGIQLGEILGWANVNNVNKIEIEDGLLVVERLLEKRIEVLEVPMPAVLTVSKSINVPQRPNMRAVLAAGKKPVQVCSAEELNISFQTCMETLSVQAPDSVDRKNIVFSGGDTEKMVNDFIRGLKSEGVL